MVSTVIRLFTDPVETSESRRLQAGEREGSAVSRESNQRSLFDDLGSIVVSPLPLPHVARSARAFNTLKSAVKYRYTM